VKYRVPQWIPTVLLVLLVPLIGYLVVSNIEDTRSQQELGAQTDAEANMIAFMHQQYDSQHRRHGFHWTIQRRDGPNTLVCYCDGKGYGWWYQVQATPDGQFTAAQVADTSAASTTPQGAAFPTMIP
jgi:hypothetical protein